MTTHNTAPRIDLSKTGMAAELERSVGTVRPRPRLFLIRGLPGSGKTTAASKRCSAPNGGRGIHHVEADSFFVRDGTYRFDPALLRNAHEEAQFAARWLMVQHGQDLVVSNTFSQHWEMKPYLDMAVEVGARVCVIDLFDAGLTDEELSRRGTHEVPVASIARMRARWEHGNSFEAKTNNVERI